MPKLYLRIGFSKVMNTKDPLWGTVKKEDIKATQIIWIQYRDAWVKFAAVRCPRVNEVSLKTLLTKERIKQLSEFVE